MTKTPNGLSLTRAVNGIAEGTLTAKTLVSSCLERSAAREPAVRAFVHYDPEAALAAARRLDHAARKGALHGIPVGIKDIIDTADMPTEGIVKATRVAAGNGGP